jgi:hypothetical protein
MMYVVPQLAGAYAVSNVIANLDLTRRSSHATGCASAPADREESLRLGDEARRSAQ